MANFNTEVFYQEYGADMTGVATEYDAQSGITVDAVIRLDFPLDNHAEVYLFVHHPGDPSPPTAPTHTVTPQNKGEGVAIKKVGKGLRVCVNGHLAHADPNPHPAGSRLTTLERVIVPDIFPA